MSIGIAIQTYSVAGACERDLLGTLRRLREMGYQRVEFDGLYGHDAGRVGQWLRDVGMSCCGLHVPLERLEDRPHFVAEACAALGAPRAAVSFVGRPETPVEAERLRTRLDAGAAALAGWGRSLVYHIHDWEFTPWGNGARPIDVLLTAERVGFEPDLGWVWHAGEDPVAFLGGLRGRCTIAHVKDFASRGDRASSCAIGAGAAPVQAILGAAPGLGVETLVVEMNLPPGADALEAAGRSVAWLMGSSARG